MSIDQIKNAFTPASETYCELSEWFLSDTSSTSALPVADQRYTRLMQDKRLTKFDPLAAILTYTDCSAQPGDHVMAVRLWLFQGTGYYRIQNPVSLGIQISIGCFWDSSILF